MTENAIHKFAWYIDITPNQMFLLYDYPIPGKDGLPLCEQHGRPLEMKEVVLYNEEATEASPLAIIGYAWVSRDGQAEGQHHHHPIP